MKNQVAEYGKSYDAMLFYSRSKNPGEKWIMRKPARGWRVSVCHGWYPTEGERLENTQYVFFRTKREAQAFADNQPSSCLGLIDGVRDCLLHQDK
jgi:hypothetical protein